MAKQSDLLGQIIKEVHGGLSCAYDDETVRKLFRELIANQWRDNEADDAFDDAVDRYAAMACEFLSAEIPRALYTTLGLVVGYASTLTQRSVSGSPISKEKVKDHASRMVNKWIDGLPVNWPARHRSRKTMDSTQAEKERLRRDVVEAMVTCLGYKKKPTREFVVRELNRFARDGKRIGIDGLRSRLHRHKLRWEDLIEEAKSASKTRR